MDPADETPMLRRIQGADRLPGQSVAEQVHASMVIDEAIWRKLRERSVDPVRWRWRFHNQ
jgi:hypothetical protein